MKADLWKKIDELFAAAQAQPAGDRAAFLDRVCEGDQELRAELESLLKAATADKSFLEHPPSPPSDRPALKPGDKLGAFEIVERIGRGGMGEVYRARDSRLKRDVAIKVLPPDFADDPGRLRRFEHEARAASALKHPNVVTVYEIGSTGGISWMVTELVEGRSLREALARGAMTPRKAAEIAAQIADGLAAAHGAGLVHRDLKAENVMLAPGDLVKILDFGIAKRAVRDVGASTVTDTLTRTGEVVGTVTSMSPEQVEGKEVDHRSDIFGLGVLLYEMLSGRRPFTGDTHAAVMNAIVSADPPDLPTNVPEAIAAVVYRCLEKLPERRFQSAADLGYALRLVIAAHPHEEGHQKTSRRALVATLVPALVLATAGAAYWWLREVSNSADLRPAPLMSWPGKTFLPSFSPDGNKVVFEWNSEKEDAYHLYVEQIGSGARPVQLTSSPANDLCPAWSPDDRYIAFLRHVSFSPDSHPALMLVPSVGGPERKEAEFSGSAAYLAWTPDSMWLATSLRDTPKDPFAIWLVSVSSGERRRLTSPTAGRLGDTFPSISPDGRTLAFFRDLASYIAAPYVLALSREFRAEREPRELTSERWSFGSGIAWTANGRNIVYSGATDYQNSLFRLPAFGTHSPQRLAYAIQNAIEPTICPLHSRLVYVQTSTNFNLWRSDIHTGERKMLVSSNGTSDLPQYSPDGRKLAFQSNRSGEGAVWTCDAEGSGCVQLTSFGNTTGGTPRWSPDSQWIAFDWRVEGQSQIYVIRADGGGQRRITNDPFDNITPSWSRDGRWVYFASNRTGRWETWKVPPVGGSPVEVKHVGMGPVFESTDGGYLYYMKRDGFGDGPGPILRRPVKGGAEVPITPKVASWGSFSVAAKGIYFSPDGKTIQRLEFSSGKISTLATVEKGLNLGLCVSPDEAFVVWSQSDRYSAELMLVEGFR